MGMLNRALNIALGLALLLAPLAGWGQGGKWNYLTGGNLMGIKAIGNNIWAVGDQGMIIHSSDGGGKWEIQPANTQQNLTGVSFSDTLRGWAVGEWGTLLKTTDGGKNWLTIPPPWMWHYYRVFAIDSINIWIATSSDSIMKSTDGGASWLAYQASPRPIAFSGLSFTDVQRGWAVGSGGIWSVVHTTDGGITWTERTDNNYANAVDIAMADSLEGWAVVPGGPIYHTINGWNTLTLQTSGSNAFLNAVSFANNTIGYVAGGENNNPAHVLFTTNSGNTWIRHDLTTDISDLNGVATNSTSICYSAGYSGIVAKTTNAGQNWGILTNLDASGQTMFNLALADTQSGYAVGPYGIVVKTTNGGTIWQSQNLGGTSLWFYGVDSPDPNYAWACGDGGSIYATKNGGATWVSQNSGVTWYLNSVDMVDTLFGVAVGGGTGKNAECGMRNADLTTKEEIAFLRSAQDRPSSRNIGDPRNDNPLKPWESPPLTDKWQYVREGEKSPQAQYRVITRTMDGTNWQGQTTSATPLTGVSFASKAEGWACGVSGTMIHTSDSGATWQIQNSNVTNTLYWVIFPTPLNGWAVGTGGTIIATTDGGNTWNRQTSNTTIDLFSAAFIDAQRGWIVGDSGLALQTTDGGTTWFFDTTQTKIPLFAESFTDQDHGWSIGGFGLTLGYGRAGLWGVEIQPEGRRRIAEGRLEQSYPNPMRETCAIGYWLNDGQGDPGLKTAGAGKGTRGQGADLSIYDITGRKVRSFASLRMTDLGRHTVIWDGRDEAGKNVPAGVYFYQLRAKELTETKKIVKIQ